MKKLFAFSFLGTCILFGVSPIKADYDRYGIEMGDQVEVFDWEGDVERSAVTKVYKYNSETGKRILINTNQHCQE